MASLDIDVSVRKLRWTDTDYSPGELVDMFEHKLPFLVLTTRGYMGRDERVNTVAAGEAYWLKEVIRMPRIIVETEAKKYFSIPADSKHEVRPISGGIPGNDKMTLKELIQNTDSRQFCFIKSGSMSVSVGPDQATSFNFGYLRVVEEYDERFLVAHPLLTGQLSPDAFAVPVYMPITFVIAVSLARADQQDFYEMMLTMKLHLDTVRTQATLIQQIKDTQEILMFDSKPTEGAYDFVEPATYVSLGDLLGSDLKPLTSGDYTKLSKTKSALQPIKKLLKIGHHSSKKRVEESDVKSSPDVDVAKDLRAAGYHLSGSNPLDMMGELKTVFRTRVIPNKVVCFDQWTDSDDDEILPKVKTSRRKSEASLQGNLYTAPPFEGIPRSKPPRRPPPPPVLEKPPPPAVQPKPPPPLPIEEKHSASVQLEPPPEDEEPMYNNLNFLRKSSLGQNLAQQQHDHLRNNTAQTAAQTPQQTTVSQVTCTDIPPKATEKRGTDTHPQNTERKPTHAPKPLQKKSSASWNQYQNSSDIQPQYTEQKLKDIHVTLKSTGKQPADFPVKSTDSKPTDLSPKPLQSKSSAMWNRNEHVSQPLPSNNSTPKPADKPWKHTPSNTSPEPSQHHTPKPATTNLPETWKKQLKSTVTPTTIKPSNTETPWKAVQPLTPAPVAVAGVTRTVSLPGQIASMEDVPNDLSKLTIVEVGECLSLLKMGHHRQNFEQALVDGALLQDLDSKALKEEFGLTHFDSIKLIKFVKEKWRPGVE